jgi:hypothetical protein
MAHRHRHRPKRGQDRNGADTRRKFKPAREIDWGAGPVYTKGS